MRIERSAREHVEPWAQLRAALWPEQSVDEHRHELLHILSSEDDRGIAFIARLDSGEVIGFTEASLRNDYVNGCDTSPVLFLEGIYVHSDHRRKGVAQLLCNAVARWGRSAGCSEFASDALLENTESHRFHSALGFEETERVVYFRRFL